jgi:hypothetical protein
MKTHQSATPPQHHRNKIPYPGKSATPISKLQRSTYSKKHHRWITPAQIRRSTSRTTDNHQLPEIRQKQNKIEKRQQRDSRVNGKNYFGKTAHQDSQKLKLRKTNEGISQ